MVKCILVAIVIFLSWLAVARSAEPPCAGGLKEATATAGDIPVRE